MTDATNAPGPGGPGRNPEQMAQRRAAMIAATEAVRAAYPHEIGLRYGPAERNTVDLYLPNGDPAGPTIVFLHGGGFRNGDASSVGDHGLAYLQVGGIFCSMGYRLVPEARFPTCAEDVEHGLMFVRDEVERRGGDPAQIYLSGHSAGAMLAAQVGLRPGPDIDRDLVKGLVLISGMYDFTRQSEEVVDRESPRYAADLCIEIDRLPAHTITVAGDDDFPPAQQDAKRMADAISAQRGSVEYFVEPNADHFAANTSFITPGGVVAEATKKMMGLPAGVPDTTSSGRA